MCATINNSNPYNAHKADTVIHRDAEDEALVVIYNTEFHSVRVVDLDAEESFMTYCKVRDLDHANQLAAKHA